MSLKGLVLKPLEIAMSVSSTGGILSFGLNNTLMLYQAVKVSCLLAILTSHSY